MTLGFVTRVQLLKPRAYLIPRHWAGMEKARHCGMRWRAGRRYAHGLTALCMNTLAPWKCSSSFTATCPWPTSNAHCARAVKGMDYVFLCAAHTSGAAVIRTTPLVHITPNVLINTLMLEAAHRAKVAKFCFISSGAAYPPTADRPVREAEMFDGDPHDVYFAAGWMKRYAEILCRTYAEKIAQPMPTVVVRPSNVYGPYDKFDFAVSHVTAALIRRVVERQNPLEVWGTGEDIRDLIYVDDFIEGLACRLRHRPALSCGQHLQRDRPLRPADPAEDPGRRPLRQRQRPLRSPLGPAPSRCG